MPTQKELEQIEKAQSTLKEILKVHMREPFTQTEVRGLTRNIVSLKKNGCEFSFTDDIVKRDSGLVPYNIVKGDNGDAWVKTRGEKYSPSQISAFILQKMKETA